MNESTNRKLVAGAINEDTMTESIHEGEQNRVKIQT